MTTTDFTYTLTTKQTPEQVFKTITNVRSWWMGLHGETIEGSSEKLNDEFTFHAGGGAHYSKQKLIELIPNKKAVWLITEGALSFVSHKDEWVGTQFFFEIEAKDGKTQLTFTHQGLTPQLECYTSCTPAWTRYMKEILAPLLNN